ncbi:MAG: FG-GAP repeat domain-containing protein [Planctomycetota bacterium]
MRIGRLGLALTCAASIAMVVQPVEAQSAAAMPRPVRMREFDNLKMPFSPLPLSSPPCDVSMYLRVVDIDGDGDLDVVAAPHVTRQTRLFLNDSFGRFSEGTPGRISAPSPTDRGSWNMDAGDIDGDGDLDLVTGTVGSSYPPRWHQGIVYINDGTAHFTDESGSRLPDHVSYPYLSSWASCLADFDGDGDPDLALSGGMTLRDRSLRILRNDGAGVFIFDPGATPVDQAVQVSAQGHLFSADLDQDGDRDLVGNGIYGGISLWWNDGAGNFVSGSSTHFTPRNLPYATVSVAIGDVDGDGDLDIAAGAAYARRPINLFLNDGSGRFRDVSLSHVDQRSLSDANLSFGDFDGDGDVDMLCVLFSISMAFQGGEQLLFNDGSGHFTLDDANTEFQPRTNGGVISVAIADFDDDDDLDALIHDGGAQTTGFAICRTRYLVNTTRQLHSPTAPAVGGSWRLAVFGDSGSSALVMLSLGSSQLRLPPFGKLGLDPSSLFVWPQILAIGDSRTHSLDVPIPSFPGLAGLQLFAQSLHTEPNGAVRFSNVWTDTVR